MADLTAQDRMLRLEAQRQQEIEELFAHDGSVITRGRSAALMAKESPRRKVGRSEGRQRCRYVLGIEPAYLGGDEPTQCGPDETALSAMALSGSGTGWLRSTTLTTVYTGFLPRRPSCEGGKLLAGRFDKICRYCGNLLQQLRQSPLPDRAGKHELGSHGGKRLQERRPRWRLTGPTGRRAAGPRPPTFTTRLSTCRTAGGCISVHKMSRPVQQPDCVARR